MLLERLSEERKWLVALNDPLDGTMTLLGPYGITGGQVDAVMASMARDVEPYVEYRSEAVIMGGSLEHRHRP